MFSKHTLVLMVRNFLVFKQSKSFSAKESIFPIFAVAKTKQRKYGIKGFYQRRCS
nr:MAG TPA: hypothetical protein [Caudoviricetes sp.]